MSETAPPSEGYKTYRWIVDLPINTKLWSPLIDHKWRFFIRKIDYRVSRVVPARLSYLYEITLLMCSSQKRGVLTECVFYCNDKEVFVGKRLFRTGRTIRFLVQRSKFANQNKGVVTVKIRAVHKQCSEENPVVDPETKDTAYFNVRGYVIRVDRNVMSAGSPVLKELLAPERNALPCPTIHESEYDIETMNALVTYIARKEYPDLNMVSAKNLLLAAHTYEVVKLKMFCGKFLSSNLSQRNAVCLMFLGDLYGINFLRAAAVSYILQNYPNVDNVRIFHWGIVHFPGILAEIKAKEE